MKRNFVDTVIYGECTVIREMEGISAKDAKVGDTVYVWWEHEKQVEFITKSGKHFFIPNWQLNTYVRLDQKYPGKSVRIMTGGN